MAERARREIERARREIERLERWRGSGCFLVFETRRERDEMTNWRVNKDTREIVGLLKFWENTKCGKCVLG